ncbi:F0F1 ATP synthase subunit B [Notoacmeibacter sp. MSK16QG-6]|uniref:F0F1 ATP synthase subunit B n=1 Tax=Notoacmeibacter sp. MSK16QG-6 TaxID=2957982 RepID=UPI0020A01E5B|nr:F0F1 ATP synthase subunit B [Notoacmeibacter sp. MSK16QG-6]MCP1198266.1 F0F1 ATP synthase subunit B [Notoacmeibacter sp. MSK16QG-6]
MFVTPAFAQSDGESHAVTEAETHSEVGHDGGHSDVFPPFDPTYYPSQLLWLAITFGLFYLILKSVILPRIAGTLETRRDRIAQDLDQAARMREEANEATAAYEQELAEARAKANKLSNDAQEKAKAEADSERARVEQELDAKLAEAETRIAAIRAEAMQDVGEIARETATAIVGAILGSADEAKVANAVENVRKEETV